MEYKVTLEVSLNTKYAKNLDELVSLEVNSILRAAETFFYEGKDCGDIYLDEIGTDKVITWKINDSCLFNDVSESLFSK